MTFDEYIQNPGGKKNAAYSFKDMYRKMYTEKLDKLRVRENGIIKYALYITDTDFYIHMKIPSEVVPKFYYDTIARFTPPKGKGEVIQSQNLNNYDVQFYSNDPSFVYTFTHAFIKSDMFITDLEFKMNKLALKHVAKERNPQDQVGYVKSIFFMYLEMKRLNLFSKLRWNGVAQTYNKNIWKSTVEFADIKIKERQEKGEAIAKKNRRIKKANPDRKLPSVNNKLDGITKFINIDKHPGQMKNANIEKLKKPFNVIKNFGKFKKK